VFGLTHAASKFADFAVLCGVTEVLDRFSRFYNTVNREMFAALKFGELVGF
jgi:hypothetical protein